MKKVLVLGGGHTADKRMSAHSLNFYNASAGDETVDTIDWNADANPTWTCDLAAPGTWACNMPIHTHAYDEVHAYEILEHIGKQGDLHDFFHTFANIWWALKKGGLLFASCPSYKSLWAWGDPGHTRILNAGSLVFLCKSEYEKQVGKTAMSDYRNYLVGDWEIVNLNDDGESFRFVMRAK